MKHRGAKAQRKGGRRVRFAHTLETKGIVSNKERIILQSSQLFATMPFVSSALSVAQGGDPGVPLCLCASAFKKNESASAFKKI